jgi:hypothetical protein
MKLSLLGLAFFSFLALTVTGCQLYFGDEKGAGDGVCLADGYYVNGEWVSATCPGGGNKCAAEKDCAAGCTCDAATSTCVETGFCSVKEDCAAGFDCDTQRSTCVPVKYSCAGELAPTCTNGAPKCTEGSVPLIQDGCYTDINGDGQFDCMVIKECTAAPACEAFQYSSDCSNAACTVVTRGENCRTSTGTTCTDGAPGCICQKYTFERCETKM